MYKSCKFNAFFKNKSFGNIIGLIITFTLVSISWIFFRSENLTVAIEILYKITHPIGYVFLDKTNLTYSLIGILLLFIVEILQENSISFKSKIFFKFKYFEFFIMASLIIIILLLGVFDGGQFIYFQF